MLCFVCLICIHCNVIWFDCLLWFNVMKLEWLNSIWFDWIGFIPLCLNRVFQNMFPDFGRSDGWNIPLAKVVGFILGLQQWNTHGVHQKQGNSSGLIDMLKSWTHIKFRKAWNSNGFINMCVWSQIHGIKKTSKFLGFYGHVLWGQIHGLERTLKFLGFY